MVVSINAGKKPPPRRPAWRGPLSTVLVTGIALLGMPALAQQPTIFNEHRVLKHLGAECRGAQSCTPVKVGRLDLAAGQQQITTFQCPPESPYFVGWDTSQHEHIRALLITQPNGGDDPATINSRATILAENRGTTSGHVTIFLGCSSDPGRPKFLMHEIGGIPSASTQTATEGEH